MLKSYLQTVKGKSTWTKHSEYRGWLNSQTWRGIDWLHDLAVVMPRTPLTTTGAILEITGDNVRDEDLEWGQFLADESGVPVAILMQIPNQPIYDLAEDDLIAFSYDEYLQSGDATWPVLFPMVASAIAAMDELEKHLGFNKFVVTGASKRGWTSWLVGESGDSRVKGIAPRVFDNLNMVDQLVRQLQYWGQYSEMIDPYVVRKLHERLDSPEGQGLLHAVDPWFHLKELASPALILNGSNDPYWTVDALSLYWKSIPNDPACFIEPNAAHRLSEEWLPTLGAFALARLTGKGWPTLNLEGSELVSTWPMDEVVVWEADAPRMRFAGAEWRPIWSTNSVGNRANLPKMSEPIQGLDKARIVEARLKLSENQNPFRLSLPVQVSRFG